MTYFGLPYIHAVFDVAAWLASMTAFWLVDAPSPAGRGAARQPRAASRRLCHRRRLGRAVRRHVLRHGQCAAVRRACAGLLHGRRHRRRHRLDRSLQALHRRHAARPASSSPRPSPRPWRWAAGLLLLRPRRLHLRHADRAALGRRFRRRHRAAIPCSSTNRFAMAAMFVVLILRFRARDRFWLRQRLLPHRRLVWAAALRLGILQALCNRDRAVQPLPLWSASAWSCTLPS